VLINSVAATSGRLDHVDGLRALAALWVVFYHGYVFFFEQHMGQSNALLRVMSRGHLGVPMFLLLSGFCLGLPYLQRGVLVPALRPFVIRRIWRILPPYYLVMAGLVLLVQLPGLRRFSVQQPTDMVDVVLHLLLLHNLSGDHVFRISGPFWSIALECQLYVVFPLLLRWMRHPGWVLVASLVLGATLWGLAPPLEWMAEFVYWHSLPSLLCFFVAGMVAAAMVAKGRFLSAWTALVALGFFVMACFIPGQPAFSRLLQQLCIGGGTGLFLVQRPGSITARLLGAKPLVAVGVVSYTLYLTHNPVVSLGGKLTLARLGVGWAPVCCAISAAVAVGVAFAAFPVIERPFHAIARRLAQPRQS
jgi:peptidoglycan/LPS O-acetylase OafA/YrhL